MRGKRRKSGFKEIINHRRRSIDTSTTQSPKGDELASHSRTGGCDRPVDIWELPIQRKEFSGPYGQDGTSSTHRKHCCSPCQSVHVVLWETDSPIIRVSGQRHLPRKERRCSLYKIPSRYTFYHRRCKVEIAPAGARFSSRPLKGDEYPIGGFNGRN